MDIPLFDVDQEEIKEVFSINTLYSRVERYTLKDLCNDMDWYENRTEKKGSLFWFIDAMNDAQKKFIRQSEAYFNRYPKASVVWNKREFHILIKKYEELFPDAFKFVPETFVLPDEIKKYRKYLDENENPVLIAKPSRGRGGDGIFFVKEFKDLDVESMKEFYYVTQKYVPNPFLIERKKFDFRLYLMIKGVDHMEGFIAFEGLTRFCTEEYVYPKKRSEVNEEELLEFGEDDLMGHLTNYCFNKDSDKYVNNQNFKENDNGSKRLLTSVMKIMKQNGVDTDKFKADVKDLWAKLVYIFQPYLVHQYHKEIGIEGVANQNCFHIFGIDVLLDENHKLWILEINCFPSFSYFFEKVAYNPETKSRVKMKEISKLDKHLKSLLLKEAIAIVTGKPEEATGVFEKVFPPEHDIDEYFKLSIYEQIRMIFEELSSSSKPDYLWMAQFQKLWECEGLKYEALTK